MASMKGRVVHQNRHLLRTMNTYEEFHKSLAGICWDFLLWSKVLNRHWLGRNNTMKLWTPYCSIHVVTFSPTCLPFFCCIFKQVKKSDHCPMCIVIFWQSPRKNYIFLCLSGSCLLFSVCEGKKWVGVPSDVFVGVRLDDMVREGIGFGPLGGKGRGVRQGVEILMHHRFLPLCLVLLSL